MFERIALYAGLRSTYQELSRLRKGRRLNVDDVIGGFQRGLIVLQTLDMEFDVAFSSSGYFFVNILNGEIGNLRFERERGWSKQEARRRLRRGGILELMVELDGHANVELIKPKVDFFPYRKVDRIPVEEYLMKEGAFLNLKRDYDMTKENLLKLKQEGLPATY